MKLKLITASLLALLLSGCTSAGLLIWNSTLKLTAEHSVVNDVAYGQHDWQKLDIHIPEQIEESKRPVIVFFYGGSWDSGSKEMYFFIADSFARLGYIVVIPDYRLYPNATFPGFIEDGAAALAWVRENIEDYGGATDKVVVSGHSAGAHLGALLLSDERYLNEYQLSPRDIKGFAGIAGPYNFSPSKPRLVEIFGPETNYPNIWASSFVNGDEPPMLLLHSEGDTTVGVHNQTTLLASLKQAGVDSQGIVYPELSHIGILLSVTRLFRKQTNTMADIDRFFKRVIGNQS